MKLIEMLKISVFFHYIKRYKSRFRNICIIGSMEESNKNKKISKQMSKHGKQEKIPQQGQKLRTVKYKEMLGSLPVPSVVNILVIGSGASGTSKSVMLSTEHSRYLFNCGEGVQRILTEFKHRISRIEHMLITHNSWEKIGGLYGLALTLEGTKIPGFKIHGPPRVENVVTSMRDFAELHNMKVTKHNMANGDFSDHALTFETIPISKSRGSEEPNAKKSRMDSSIDPEASVSYLCKFTSQRGKLNLEKYVDLGIPRNPKYLRALTSGESVTLEDGREIKSDDVMDSPIRVAPVLICDCPSEEYVDNMMSCDRLINLSTSDHCPQVIVHFAPHNVVEAPKYQNWLKSFDSATKHIILDERKNPLVSRGIYKIQAHLNLLHQTIFPKLPEFKNDSVPNENVYYGQTNLNYHIRKPLGIDYEKCVEIDNQDFLDEIFEQDNVKNELEIYKSKLSEVEHRIERKNPYPELVFLGTGSSVPSRDRNVSGILLNISENRSMLLDCGEGTLAQLWRHYGAKTPEILRKIHCIFVSHMHADHHMGIFSVLKGVREFNLNPQPVTIFAPGLYFKWLKMYRNEVNDKLEWFKVINHEALFGNDKTDNKELYQRALDILSMSEYELVKVKHTNSSYAVCLTHKDGWKIVYSGDAMPSDALVDAGKNCDILIHEATMEDDLAAEAAFKSHSTTSQAIDIGIRMKARFILLNHFSQRYSKIPVFNSKFSDKVGITFDNMRVTLDDFPILPLFTEPLKHLFAEHVADMEEKTEKKRLEKVLLEAEKQKN